MSHFTRARGAVAPIALGVASAALLIVGSMATPTLAQTTTTAKPAPVRATTSMRRGPVDERIAALRRELRITPAQEQDWEAVAQVMRSNDEEMRSLVQETRNQSPRERRNALEDLQIYQKFAQAHADRLQKLTAAFTTLYNGMSPEQKANADRVFRSFGRNGPNGRRRS